MLESRETKRIARTCLNAMRFNRVKNPCFPLPPGFDISNPIEPGLRNLRFKGAGRWIIYAGMSVDDEAAAESEGRAS
jgi:hypothetical protein